MSSWYPDVIATDARLKALADLSARLESLPVERALTHLVDAVDERLLPHLAQGWHVTDLEGWRLADTAEKRRALLRRAIALHRKKGTPWAIKQALSTLWFGVDIIDLPAQRAIYREHLPRYLDGSWRLDGSVTVRPLERLTAIPQIQHWATFIARASLADATHPVALSSARALIEHWKPMRSHMIWLLWVFFEARFDTRIGSGWSVAARLPSTRLYPWGNKSLSDYADARWRLGRDGDPVRLPAAFGGFRVGERRGAVAGQLLREARASVGTSCQMSAIVATRPAETIPHDPQPTILPAARLIDRQRRLDGRWRLHHASFGRPFGFRLSHAAFRERLRFGAFALGDRRIAPAPARLTVSGRWHLGAPRNPELIITRMH